MEPEGIENNTNIEPEGEEININLNPEGGEHEIVLEHEDVQFSGVTSVNGKTGAVILTTSDLENDSGYQNEEEVANSISEHNESEEAHPYIQDLIDEKQDILTAGNSVEISEDNEISVIVDNNLSVISTNPVQNNVITENLATKVDADDLAAVAFTGEYDDLENEPQDFTEEEWNLLWTNY